MAKTEISQSPELPSVLRLGDAIEANKYLWRNRDRFLTASSPIELSKSAYEPVFDRVRKHYSDYVNPVHKDQVPLASYSVWPEIVLGWGHGYYFVDFDKDVPMTLLVEFATEWLSREAFNLDPFKGNNYVGNAERQIKKEGIGLAENRILNGLIWNINKRSVSKMELTKTFASFLLAHDLEPMDRLVNFVTDGKLKNYSEGLGDQKWDESPESDFSIVEMSKLKSIIAKPSTFVGLTGAQIVESFSQVAQVVVPGLINLSFIPVPVLTNLTLAHEYVHALSYNEKSSSGVNIKGYKMAGGFVVR